MILVLFQATETQPDKNFVEIYEKKTKILFQAAFLSRPLCSPKADEKI